MLFNSFAFLMIFLPAVLAGFIFLTSHHHQRAAAVWLTGASFFFYGWWSPSYLFLLFASIVINYALAGYLLRRPSRGLLAVGIAANILLLAYYKYFGFFVSVTNQATGLDWAVPNIVLPLAISFFTFQQIAYLIDAHDGAVVEHDFLNYCLFITFFPHLIAGPITHHREMLPQFSDPNVFRPTLEGLGVGATLFLLGLFKKIAIADTMGGYARPIYAAASDGVQVTFFDAWAGGISYALQVYFDFSGYTDMAIGLGLMFGVSLPPNFDSPFKARNIIEFWSRWHMTLTRFVTAYIYNPIVIRVARSRTRKGRPLPKRGRIPPGAFVSTVAFPTILSLFIIGVWHGAGWQFAIFGLIHGFLLTINHAWRQIKVRLGLPLDSNHPVAVGTSVLFTFLCVVIALVFFRADDVPSALSLISGMIGANGIVLPERFFQLLHITPGSGMRVGDLAYFGLNQGIWIAALLVVVWALPNSQQWLRNYRTALQAQPRRAWLQVLLPAAVWHPSLYLGLTVGWLGFFIVLRALSEAPTEFLYFQF